MANGEVSEPQQLYDEEGRPIIVTTELGQRLFQDRLDEMRRINPNLKEPHWVIRPDKPEEPDGRSTGVPPA